MNVLYGVVGLLAGVVLGAWGSARFIAAKLDRVLAKLPEGGREKLYERVEQRVAAERILKTDR